MRCTPTPSALGRKKRPVVKVWTDGAISKQRGPGGWACVLQAGGSTKEFSGIADETTSSRMELEAAIQALWKLSKPCFVTIYSDSEYLVKSFNERRVHKWDKNGWRTTAGKKVANIELWATLLALTNMHIVQFEHVKGHNGDPMNERADELAKRASKLARETFGEGAEGKDTPEPDEEPEEPPMGYMEARERMKA